MTDDETIRHYLAEAYESGDSGEIRTSLGHAVKDKGTKEIAKRVGPTSKTLKQMLAYEHVNCAAIAIIVSVLGLRMP
ncbi:hypothetical protein [Paraburkholderia sp. BL23I1N1]|uniref:hypothetical protein n=1 Tax=Paraburkholderia sp. BL23I1N1 TaxID=1938802 RepID=UPI0038F7EE08